jgi:hypothetical protein
MLTSFNSLFIASLYICLIIGCKKSRAKNYMLLLPPRDIQEDMDCLQNDINSIN